FLSLGWILAHPRYFCWIWIKLSAPGGGDVLHRGDRLHFREDRCLSIGQVQRKACKDKTPENISERHRYLVPQPPVGERDLRAENHSGRDHKHIDYRMFKPLAKESKDGQPHGDNLTDRGLGRKRHHHSHRYHPVAENGLNEDRRKTGMTQLGVAKSLGFARGDKHLRHGRPSRYRTSKQNCIKYSSNEIAEKHPAPIRPQVSHFNFPIHNSQRDQREISSNQL